MDTFTAPAPSVASSGATTKVRMLQNHFNGDASDAWADGINVCPLTFQATWDLSAASVDPLLAFLRAHAGRSFAWTMPRETTARTWQATSWTRTVIDADHDQLQVSFEERFLP